MDTLEPQEKLIDNYLGLLELVEFGRKNKRVIIRKS